MNLGKILFGLFGILFAIAGPGLLIAAGWWFAMDRPAYHVGWCPLCFGWSAGAGAQIAGLKTAFATEQASLNAEKAALDAQNRATLALRASADAWQARGQAAVQRASRDNAWRLRTADSILRQTLPADMSDAEQCRAAETVLRGAAR